MHHLNVSKITIVSSAKYVKILNVSLVVDMITTAQKTELASMVAVKTHVSCPTVVVLTLIVNHSNIDPGVNVHRITEEIHLFVASQVIIIIFYI